ncbi:MAG: TRAP transporter small permease [Clostridiales bacterium]|nr:TRAP transporter small permease [Clostridiales bacterium]
MKILNWLDEHLEEALLCVMLMAITVIMGIQVFSRYVLSNSLSWSEEITRYLFIWSAFLSLSYCTKKKINIRVDQFTTLLPDKYEYVLKAVGDGVCVVLFIYLLPFAFTYLTQAVNSGQLSPACGIPMYFIQVSPLVGFVLVIFRFLQRFYGEIKKLSRANRKGEN